MLLRVFLYLFLNLALILLSGCATTTTPRGAAPEALFQEGEELYAKKHYEDAIARWKKMKEGTTAPDLVAQADLKIADAQFEGKNYIEAAASYEDFRKLHPNHEKTPYALYRLGLCYYNLITGIDTEQTPVKNAVTMFETFLRQYSSSEFAKEAREKLEACRIKQLQYEIYVGRFYFRTEKYQAAIKRLHEALVQFPEAKINDETLFYLGRAYLGNGERSKGEETFTRLFNEFPSSRYAAEARKILKKG
jgi:outer membrane protein assembly factor BamD